MSETTGVGWYDLGVGKLRVRARGKNGAPHDVPSAVPDPLPPFGPTSPSAADVASFAGAMLKLPDSVVIVDEEGSVVWGNAAALRLFGLTLSDGVGISGLSLVHPDDHELVLRSLDQHSGQGRRRSH